MLFRIFIGESAMRKLFSFYLYAIIIGTILLCLPISLRNVDEYVKYVGGTHPIPYTFFDALYTAVSAFSDTGLSTMVVGQTYNWFGQLVIMLLIQIGGLGLFTMYWMFWNMFFNNYIYKKRKGLPLHEPNRMSFRNQMIVSSERGNTKLGLTNQTIKSALLFIIVTEVIFAGIYAICFATIPAYYQESIDVSNIPEVIINNNKSLETEGMFNGLMVNSHHLLNTYHSWYALWAGIFQSVSTINNAGFDIVGVDSMAPYRNGLGTIFQLFTIIQIVIGGIGYPVIYDIMQAIARRKQGLPYKFSLFSKISLISYFSVSIVGMIFMFGFSYGLEDSLINKINILTTNPDIPDDVKLEADKYFGKGPIKIWNEINSIFFSVANARSAGFSTFNQAQFSSPNMWIMIIMMFIGCAPSSTGGGIRTTTLAVMLWTVVSKTKNYKQTVIFNRAIPNKTVVDAFLIALFGIGIIILPSLIVYPLAHLVNQNITVTDTIFEVASAFGTVGLSAGVSSTITNYDASSIINCLILSIVMIIGQLGVPTAIFTFKKKFSKNISIDFPVEDVKIS